MVKTSSAKKLESAGQSKSPNEAVSGERESRPSPIDVHVGGRIRLRRTLLQMSQERLGDALGLTFQQVQKYERGANRVGASRLFDLSRVLDVPVSFFFDDLPAAYGSGGGARSNSVQAGGFAEAQDGFGAPDDLFSRKETVDLVRAYYRIIEQPVRKRVLDLIKSMGPERVTE
ncbi:helix-turn-helix transcriptional regulator [Lichenicola cladoniae]|uniref:Helix-turn-helix transcriptional regulator n=1 Tax=Lichenicola cladoniae TaxID=1484109 RepID=A0A6M8HL54_9PROT|nr:helix-turn-helix transcriptional regulator [Lichenicola cladoniae]NPD69267.1 helix-turn-helix transcriptional regulator [Acetobacteraceae bacterium]QKE89084.1 helix-turn-helix transcriptional regulator [Lichenicola cladoniae]